MVRVRDSGVGIPRDMLPRLFELFMQVEGSNERIPCLFNPSSITVARSNNWAANPMPGNDPPGERGCHRVDRAGIEPATYRFSAYRSTS